MARSVCDLKKLILIRHANTDVLESRQVDERQWDESLSEIGFSQARALSQRLSKIHIDAVYSSPQPRAMSTASMIGAAVIVEDLEDWNDDTLCSVHWRVTRFTDSLREGTFVIVTHGTPIAVILCHCIHAPYVYHDRFGITPASVSVIQDGVIVVVNDTAHLNLWAEVADYNQRGWIYEVMDANG